uniref:Uncharacterized protein n=1 Tax=Glossina pallidipes TaxID=7398 RepID=A0A1A9ZRH1_GLOPL
MYILYSCPPGLDLSARSLDRLEPKALQYELKEALLLLDEEEFPDVDIRLRYHSIISLWLNIYVEDDLLLRTKIDIDWIMLLYPHSATNICNGKKQTSYEY